MELAALDLTGPELAERSTPRSPCAVCLGVLQSHHGLVRKDDLLVLCNHHPTLADLKSAAFMGCKFCLVYWNMLTSTEKDLMLQKDEDEFPEYKLEASITDFGDSSLYLAAPALRSGTNTSFVYKINRVQPLTTIFDEKYAEFVLRPLKSMDFLIHEPTSHKYMT